VRGNPARPVLRGPESGNGPRLPDDIADCFGSLDRTVMLSTLAVHIHDGRFLALIGRMLQAGYLEDFTWHATLSGAPQGGIASPVLSNIYLDRFDQYVEHTLIPEYDRGERRGKNHAYHRVWREIQRARHHGDRQQVRALTQTLRRMPTQDPNDPGYRRLRYVRYCDLSRTRDKSHYADVRVMSRWSGWCWLVGVA